MFVVSAKGHDILEKLREQNGKVHAMQLRCDYYKALCPKCKKVHLWMPKSMTEVKDDTLYSKKRCKNCFKTY